jgi:hypothetical protein
VELICWQIMSINNLNSANKFFGILYLSGVLSLDCWAMNVITKTVFGRLTWELPFRTESAMKLPIASLPHLLVGCHNELFGSPILNGTFCSEEYCEKVRRGNSASKCGLVSSNHWFVLSSQALRDALVARIPLVILKGEEGKHPLFCRHQESLSSTSSCSKLISSSSSSNNNNDNNDNNNDNNDNNNDSNEITSYQQDWNIFSITS